MYIHILYDSASWVLAAALWSIIRDCECNAGEVPKRRSDAVLIIAESKQLEKNTYTAFEVASW